MARALLLAAIALVSCGLFAGDPWPRWSAATDQAFAAVDQVTALSGVEVNGAFVAAPPASQRQIRDILTDARALVAEAAAPEGARSFKEELLGLFDARSAIADARARQSGDVLALDARERAWRDDAAFFLARYRAWLGTQRR